jgi:hypothetical protein
LASGLRRKPKPSGRISSTPSAMISTSSSARALRMANSRSCLRRFEAFSISSPSAKATRSAGVFSLSSAKVMRPLGTIGSPSSSSSPDS